jgi:hypothetical protein
LCLALLVLQIIVITRCTCAVVAGSQCRYILILCCWVRRRNCSLNGPPHSDEGLFGRKSHNRIQSYPSAPAAVVVFFAAPPLLCRCSYAWFVLLSWTPLFFLDNSNDRIVYSSGQNQCLSGARQNACRSHPASAPSRPVFSYFILHVLVSFRLNFVGQLI